MINIQGLTENPGKFPTSAEHTNDASIIFTARALINYKAIGYPNTECYCTNRTAKRILESHF